MRILLFFMMLMACPSSLAAIASTAVWEWNASGTAGNLAGCIFNPGNASPGTDYTQSAGNSSYPSAKFNGTDLASSNGSTNPCVVTSGSHNFVAADEGNHIHITAGTNWTQDYYEIVSVSGNAATLDKACGSSASISSGTWYEGGACSMSTTGAKGDTLVSTDIVAGNKVWIHSGTFGGSDGDNLTFTNGTAGSPINYEGYNSTRGDLEGTIYSANRPKFNCVPGAINFGNYSLLRHMTFENQDGGTVLSSGANSVIMDMSIVVQDAGPATGMGASSVCVNCEAVCYNGNAFATSNGTAFWYPYAHDSGGYGLVIFNSGANVPVFVYGGLFENNTAGGIEVDGASTSTIYIDHTTIYGAENKLGTGLNVAVAGSTIRLTNSILYGLSTGVSGQSGDPAILDFNNDYYNNTTDVSSWVKGEFDFAVNPSFASVAQITGTTASISAGVLTDSGANFSNVTNNKDYVYLISGTSLTNGPECLITAHTTTTLTLTSSCLDGNSPTATGSTVHYQVTTGHNFAPTATGMVNTGLPQAYPGGRSTSYTVVGAIQPQSTDPGVANVNTGTSYTINGVAKSGTLTLPAIADVLGTYGSWGVGGNGSTGTLTLPAVGDVLGSYGSWGVGGSGSTGTLTLPAIGDVLGTYGSWGVAGNGSTGTLTLPAIADVLGAYGAWGVSGSGSTGTLTIPATNTVKKGTSYGVGGSGSTGTFTATSSGGGFGG